MKKFKKIGKISFLSLLLSLIPLVSLPSNSEPKKPEILVEWSNTNSFNQSSSVLKSVGGSRIKGFQTPMMRRSGKGIIEVISLPDSILVDKALETYRKIPGVVNAEPNIRYNKTEVSNDPLFLGGSLWGMYSSDSPVVGPSVTTNPQGSQAEQAWNSGYTGSTAVIVGVIDTGIDYTHPDLYLNIYLNQGEIKGLPFFSSLIDIDNDGLITFRDLNNSANSAFVSDRNGNSRIDAGDLLNDSRWENGVDNDSNGYIDDLVGWDFANDDNDPLDDNNHGTHVAGTIGAIGGNGVGVAGINWKIQLMPLKFLDETGGGYLSDAISAIDYYTLETLSKDVSFNLGSPSMFIGTNNSWGGGSYSNFLLNSIVLGAKANNYFVAAAGNSAKNNNSVGFYPANYNTVSGAGWEAIISVASIASNGSLSSFSNYGSSTVDIGAPGGNILSTFPSGGYQSVSGTSMAAPHVTGALASLLASNPSTDRKGLRNILLSSSKPTPSLAGKVVTGGRLDIWAGLRLLNSPPEEELPPSYVITGPTNVNEGGTFEIGINTQNVPNATSLYWSISGVSSSDINPGSLSSSLQILSNKGKITISAISDNLLEGTEVATFKLFKDSSRTQQVGSKSINILDVSTGYREIWGTTANNKILGTFNPDILSGVPSSGITPPALGKGQIDTASGGGGADIFMLGQVREGSPRVFYNNGSPSNVGSNDYMLIIDFNKLGDKIQFAFGRFFTRNTSTNTTIYWDRNNNGILDLTGGNRDEVIGIVQRVNLGNLTITESSKPSWALFTN